MTKNMDLVFILTLMVDAIKVNGHMVNSMVKVFL